MPATVSLDLGALVNLKGSLMVRITCRTCIGTARLSRLTRYVYLVRLNCLTRLNSRLPRPTNLDLESFSRFVTVLSSISVSSRLSCEAVGAVSTDGTISRDYRETTRLYRLAGLSHETIARPIEAVPSAESRSRDLSRFRVALPSSRRPPTNYQLSWV